MKKSHKMLKIEEELGETIENYFQREYVDNHRSALSISKEVGVSHHTIYVWLDKFGIPRKGLSEVQLPKGIIKSSKDVLEDQYIRQRKLPREIGDELGVHSTTVIGWLNGYNIPTRSFTEARLPEGVTKPSKKELEAKYLHQGLNMEEIAQEIGVSHSTVARWLDEYSIQRRGVSLTKLGERAKKLSKHTLQVLYIEQRKSPEDIGHELGVSRQTVVEWARKYGIPTRSHQESRLPPGVAKPSKAELHQMYQNEGKSSVQIGREIGVSSGAILGWLKKYDIPVRRHTYIQSKSEFLQFIQRDETARNLVIVSATLNGQGQDIERIITDLYEGRFKDGTHLHNLIETNINQIYELVRQGLTNLSSYIGNFSLEDRPIVPILIAQALESIPEVKFNDTLENRLHRLLRNVYGPRFNDEPQVVLEEVKTKVDSSHGKVRELYSKLLQHYEEVIALSGEL